MSDDAFDYLPGTLAEIAEIAGLPAALALAQEKGGVEVYIPARATDDHWLVKCVGRAAADAIGKAHGDCRLTIPLGPQSFHARARRRAAELLREGESHSLVARRLGVHTRTVERVKARMKDDDQGTLL